MSSVGNGEEFNDAAERLGERVEQFRDNAEEAARRGLDTMQNSLADLYDGLADESSRALDTIEQNIEAHPWIGIVRLSDSGLSFVNEPSNNPLKRIARNARPGCALS